MCTIGLRSGTKTGGLMSNCMDAIICSNNNNDYFILINIQSTPGALNVVSTKSGK